MQFQPSDIEDIVKENIKRVKGTYAGVTLMPDDIIKIMSLSIYDSIVKYHEFAYDERIRKKK